VSHLVKVFCGILVCGTLAGATPPSVGEIDRQMLAWMQSVLDHWETTCSRHLQVSAEPLPWIIFYDENRGMHLNPEKRLLPSQSRVSSFLTFSGRVYPLIELRHRGSLWIPDGQALPVTSNAFTMLYAGDQKPFVTMPLPAFYRKHSGGGTAPVLDELLLGLSQHELAHTRQVVYAAKRIKHLRTRYKLPDDIDDDIIENTFGKNREYVRMHEEERRHLSRAVFAYDLSLCREALAEALSASQRRRERFFSGTSRFYADLEDIFLSMEGRGMWVHYQLARDGASQDEPWHQTLFRVLQTAGDSWSENHGLKLFVLMDRLVPGWQRRFLARDFAQPSEVLAEALKTDALSSHRTAALESGEKQE